MSGAESSDPPPDLITVHIKFGGRSIPLAVSSDSPIGDIKALLQPRTNVLPRGQKLIFKGKILADTASAKSLQISNGSKIMMIASEGLHQGGGPIRKDISDNQRRVHSNQSKVPCTNATKKGKLEQWKATGVVALSECELTVIPEEVWAGGPSVRVLDLSNNFVEELPAKIKCLKSISKLLLSANNLLVERISWEGLSHLKSLTVLSLDRNRLTSLPPMLCDLTSLRQLNLANNKLTTFPDDLGLLKQLEILRAENNRLRHLPTSIGNCISLIEANFSSNHLEELPSTFGNLPNLKVLHLSNNGLKTLPNTLFMSCLQLTTLNLHGTEITNDVLRQLEGWEAFDQRRRKKHQKQLDFRVGFSGGFDEGADENNRP